jgi:hypothetical protein
MGRRTLVPANILGKKVPRKRAFEGGSPLAARHLHDPEIELEHDGGSGSVGDPVGPSRL